MTGDVLAAHRKTTPMMIRLNMSLDTITVGTERETGPNQEPMM